MLLLTRIYEWTDNRDSKKRFHKRDNWSLGYREFLINPNRIVDMVDDSTLVIAKCHFKFSDNHRDRREATSFIRCYSSSAQVETAHNLAYFSKFITLPFYPKNDPHRTPVNTTIDVEDIAYFDRYNDPNHPNCVWLVYNVKAFKRIEQLVGLSLEQAEDVAETGTTSTTTTSTHIRGQQ
jgi:hypothetical protein